MLRAAAEHAALASEFICDVDFRARRIISIIIVIVIIVFVVGMRVFGVTTVTFIVVGAAALSAATFVAGLSAF